MKITAAASGAFRVEHATRVLSAATRRGHPTRAYSQAADKFERAQIWKSCVFSRTPRSVSGGSPETARESRAPPRAAFGRQRNFEASAPLNILDNIFGTGQIVR